MMDIIKTLSQDNNKIDRSIQYLVDDDLIGASFVQDVGPCYHIKSKGEDLIWSGTTRDKIIHLLQIFECTQDDFHHFIDDDSVENIQAELTTMKRTEPRIVESVIKDDGKKYYRLTLIGENILKDKRNMSSTTNIGNQYNIGMINIQNYHTVITRLKSELEQESNLTSEEKSELHEILDDEESIWKKLENKTVELGGKFSGHTLRAFLGLD